MTPRALLAIGLLLASTRATNLRAQIIQPRFSSDPIAWTSLSIGWLRQEGFRDKDSGDVWDFGSGPQWRASLEMPIGRGGGSSWGVAGTLSRMPLIYSGGLLTGSCARCDADANISQILGVLHLGGTSGFHQVIDISGGATMFSNFRSTTGTKLGSGNTTTRYGFTIGYGFGYGFSPRASVMIVQDLSLLFLPRQSGNANNTAQQSATRLGFRYGLGSKGSRY